jgi:hypothetical protein
MGCHLGTLRGSGSGWDVGAEGQTERIRTPQGPGESNCMTLLVVREGGGALLYKQHSGPVSPNQEIYPEDGSCNICRKVGKHFLYAT